TTFCILLFAWSCLASPHPPESKVMSRRIPASEDNSNLDGIVASTRNILDKVSAFMQKLSDLEKEREGMTSQEVLTLLPNFVQEAVKLRSDLDSNVVKREDPKVVEKVKEMVTQALHSFARTFDTDGKTVEMPDLTYADNATYNDSATYAENATEVIPDAWTQQIEPEITTILAPTETVERAQETPEDELNHDPKEQGNVNPGSNSEFTPIPVPILSHPFTNIKTFSFTYDVEPYSRGSEAVLRWVPGGGYYLYHTLG
ncbi:hypothetical protein SK128_010996, partial [Halocaridina rubra]